MRKFLIELLGGVTEEDCGAFAILITKQSQEILNLEAEVYKLTPKRDKVGRYTR